MTQDAQDNIPSQKTPREQAARIVSRLEKLRGDIDHAREQVANTGLKRFSHRVMALVEDAQSLAEGISSGTITISQPRMATNLIEVVAELDAAGHSTLAWDISSVIRVLSVNGLAAENCSLNRGRFSSVPENRTDLPPK